MTKPRTDSGLAAAIVVAGGVRALAKKLKVTTGAVSQWPRVPVQHVLTIEKLTGVTRYKLRPDLYGTRAPRSTN